MRYILGLIPQEQQIGAFSKAAQAVFSSICDGYLLSEGKSFPHVTLSSFQCSDQKLAAICEAVRQSQITECPIRILGLTFKKGKIPPQHYSVSLSIARESSLLELHNITLKILREFGIELLNPHSELYLPHLTLAGIRWPHSESISLSSILDDLIAMPVEPFRLVLGKGDDIGQYLETIRLF